VTTLAIALAHVLARSKQAVALLDADLRGGNVAAYLDLDPRRGLVGLTLEGADRTVDKLIADELHEVRGFSVLAGLERGEFQGADVGRTAL
jgi:Mrp family chromosome partitioning ATPase